LFAYCIKGFRLIAKALFFMNTELIIKIGNRLVII